jgi:F-type H+-transporting ATPase subunit a
LTENQKFLYKYVYLQRNFKSRVIKKSYTYLLFLMLSFPFASNANPEAATPAENKDASAEVVEHIMNHVADANEFHIATINGHHYSLGLPCILLRDGKLSFFSSAAFHHQEEIDGYKLDHHTGRIVDVATDKRSANIVSYFTADDTSKFLDFSITKNVFTSLLGFLILAIVLISVKNAYTRNKNKSPKGIQSVIEPIINYLVEDVIKLNIGPKYEKFVPFLLSIFFFILINNLIGLIPFFPGSANASGNIAFTFVIAVIAFIIININGTKSYWGHIFAMPGVPKWVLVILTPVEVVGLFIKPIALMLRLFGNITGGHIAILSIVSLIFIFGKMGQSIGGASLGGGMAIPIVLFVNAMELFVAFLQAYVFTLLTSIFIGAAVEEHEHHGAENH